MCCYKWFSRLLYEEQQQFDISEVIFTLQQKTHSPSPRMFRQRKSENRWRCQKRWDEIKASENAEKMKQGKLVNHRRTLDAVKAGSALMQAQELQKLPMKVGFDWDVVSGAVDKLDEEVAELKEILPIDGQNQHLSKSTAARKELGIVFA